METVLRNFGNSVGFVIPKPMRDAMHFKAGQVVQLERISDGLLIRPAKPKYTLEALLAQCDSTAPMPNEVTEWQEMPAFGREQQGDQRTAP